MLAARDITVADFARQLGVSHHHTSRIIGGHVRPSERLRTASAEILGVDADLLFVEDADDVVVALVRRTTKASGVPEVLEDEATIEKVAHLLRGTA